MHNSVFLSNSATKCVRAKAEESPFSVNAVQRQCFNVSRLIFARLHFSLRNTECVSVKKAAIIFFYLLDIAYTTNALQQTYLKR